MKYKVGNFKKYKSRALLRLGFANPGAQPPVVKEEEVFLYDGFTIKLSDGREFKNAEGIQGMVEKDFVKLVGPSTVSKKRVVTKSKKKIVPKNKSQKLFASLEEAFQDIDDSLNEEALEDWEDEENEDDDFEEEEDFFEAEEIEEDEDEESGGWDEDDDDDDEDEDDDDDWDDEEDEEFDLGNGISFRNQARNVNSGRDLTLNRASSLEESALAQVGSSTRANDGGVYVGSGGGVPGFNKTAKTEQIGFESAQTIKTIMTIPEIGVGSTHNTQAVDVSQMGRNTVGRLEEQMMSQKPHLLGQTAKIAANLKKVEKLKKKKMEKLIKKRALLLEEIRQEIPEFKWNLRASPEKRFEKAIALYDRSTTSKKAKKKLNAVLKYELPEMQKRIKQQIQFERAPRRS